jgi:hypothetical protein
MKLLNCVFLPMAMAMAGVACVSLGTAAEVAAPSAALSSPSPSLLTPTPDLSLQPSVQLPQFVETATLSAVDPKSLRLTAQVSRVELPISSSSAVPLPGSTETTASGLLTPPEPPALEFQPADPAVESSARQIAQGITPGRATRSGSSYFGVGGNIGIVGDGTAVGDGSFAILSKIGLTDRISFRPAVLFGDRVTFLLPVTYDFSSVGSVASYSVAPYVGAGFAINTGGDDTFNLLGTAGVDIPLGSQFTANAAFNVTFLNEVSFGLLLGLGYNF